MTDIYISIEEVESEDEAFPHLEAYLFVGNIQGFLGACVYTTEDEQECYKFNDYWRKKAHIAGIQFNDWISAEDQAAMDERWETGHEPIDPSEITE